MRIEVENKIKIKGAPGFLEEIISSRLSFENHNWIENERMALVKTRSTDVKREQEIGEMKSCQMTPGVRR